MRLPRSASVCALAFSAIAMASCGGDEGSGAAAGGDSGAQEKPAEKQTLYANSYTNDIPFLVNKHEGMKARAAELGYEFAEDYGNGTPERQLEQIENAIIKKPAALLLTPINEEAPVPVFREGQEQGIPTIAVGSKISDPSLYLTFVGYDNEQIGRDKAEYIVEKLGGKGKVGIIHGIRGLTFSEGQAVGAAEVFKANPGIELTDGGYAGGFASDLGLQKTQNLITRVPDLDAIFFDNDDLAIGGIKALKERNIKMEDILILGTDGGEAALDVVKKGELDYTISLCGFRQGIEVVNIIDAYLKEKKEPEKTVVTKTEAFTPEDIEEKLSSLTKADCG